MPSHGNTSAPEAKKMPRPREQLCLACSCSLPSSSKPFKAATFHTKCCEKPICANCLEKNPRLQRYDPCLLCLSGAGAVGGSSKGRFRDGARVNVDGAVIEEDVFVLGDADGESETESDTPADILNTMKMSSATCSSHDSSMKEQAVGDVQLDAQNPVIADPSKYYIQPGDTLQGISLRFGLKGRDLCVSNSLPPSTLSTHPHLLHTRTFLILPPSIKSLPLRPPTPPEIAERRRMERAGKRMQMVTKEVDWLVAKAYVSLAATDDDDDEIAAYEVKRKEEGESRRSRTEGGVLESRAVERYLEDEEWEAHEIRQGRTPKLPGFPFRGFERQKSEKVTSW